MPEPPPPLRTRPAIDGGQPFGFAMPWLLWGGGTALVVALLALFAVVKFSGEDSDADSTKLPSEPTTPPKVLIDEELNPKKKAKEEL